MKILFFRSWFSLIAWTGLLPFFTWVFSIVLTFLMLPHLCIIIFLGSERQLMACFIEFKWKKMFEITRHEWSMHLPDFWAPETEKETLYLLAHEKWKMGETVVFCLQLQPPRGLLKGRNHLIDLPGLRILEQLLPILQRGEMKTTSASFQSYC